MTLTSGRSVFILAYLVLIYGLYYIYSLFFRGYWVDIIYKPPESMEFVHTWKAGDTLELIIVIIVFIGVSIIAYKTWLNDTIRPSFMRKQIVIVSITVFLYDIFFAYNMIAHKSWFWDDEVDVNFPIMSYWIGESTILLILIAFQIGLGFLIYRAWCATKAKKL